MKQGLKRTVASEYGDVWHHYTFLGLYASSVSTLAKGGLRQTVPDGYT